MRSHVIINEYNLHFSSLHRTALYSTSSLQIPVLPIAATMSQAYCWNDVSSSMQPNSSLATDTTYLACNMSGASPNATIRPICPQANVDSMLTKPWDPAPVWDSSVAFPHTTHTFSKCGTTPANLEDNTFPLTDSDSQNSDRQRRKEKKRRNAVLYRARKRQQTEQLQSQLSTSQARVGCLEAQLQVLRDENAKLVQLLRDAQKLLGDAHKLELQALQRQ